MYKKIEAIAILFSAVATFLFFIFLYAEIMDRGLTQLAGPGVLFLAGPGTLMALVVIGKYKPRTSNVVLLMLSTILLTIVGLIILLQGFPG